MNHTFLKKANSSFTIAASNAIKTILISTFVLTSCSKNNSPNNPTGTNSNLTLLGKWTLIKDITKKTSTTGVVSLDSIIFFPKGITAEFRSDSTIYVRELAGGSIYVTDIQSFKVKNNILYWTKYWSPTVTDTFTMEVFNSTKLTLYKKTSSNISTDEIRSYWERY